MEGLSPGRIVVVPEVTVLAAVSDDVSGKSAERSQPCFLVLCEVVMYVGLDLEEH